MLAVSWLRRRWAASLVSAVCFALLTQGASSWLSVLGAAVVACALFRGCVLFGAGGTFLWSAGRVSDLDRRAVLVTGCDSGFGHASALRLHSVGVGRVFALVLDAKSAGAQALKAVDAQRMCVVQCDVTNDADIAAARDAVDKELKASGCELWAVVNNAGILAVGECEWMDVKQVSKVIDVNALGQVRISQAFLPLLRKSHGRIVNINSATSRLPTYLLTPYCMSKYASLVFTDILRMDLNRFNMTVHSIEPWIIKTAMVEAFFSLLNKSLEKLPSEVKSCFGERYWNMKLKFVKLVFTITASPTSGIENVVDSVEDACLSNYPEDRYSPGMFAKLMVLSGTILYIGQIIALKILFMFNTFFLLDK